MSLQLVRRDSLPLQGRVIVITGVSRRAGIGHAIACRAAAYGASLLCHHFSPHDEQQSWGADDVSEVLASIDKHLVPGARLVDRQIDLADGDTPRLLLEEAVSVFGRVDGLVCNQALSGSDGPLGELGVDELDQHWAVDARASILLAQAFLEHHRQQSGGSIVFLTSGQALGPLPGEVAYAAAKAAIAGVTLTIADQLADHQIRVNTVNPGPVDTGYLDEKTWSQVAAMFPFGRYGEPDDAARLIVWLLTDESSWITGQIINSEGGFGRWRNRDIGR